MGNGQQGFPKKLIKSISFKIISTVKKKETLAVRFTRLLEKKRSNKPHHHYLMILLMIDRILMMSFTSAYIAHPIFTKRHDPELVRREHVFSLIVYLFF
ncbi:hypothetical protein, partial [Desulfobacula phenolica]|uniref:hypothetical protein n=1 Tax=Desulfobacula phenolica TaxID=90732 RepID=UPI001C315AFE